MQQTDRICPPKWEGRSWSLRRRYHTSVIINLFTSTGILASSSKKFARLSAYADRIVELESAAKRLALDTAGAPPPPPPPVPPDTLQ